MRIPSLQGTAGLARATAAIAAILLIPAAFALAAPEVAEILEPAEGVAPLNPADVHMVAEFGGDGDEHVCTDWQIRLATPKQPVVWKADCVEGEEKTHIHLGDGEFVGPYADPGRDALEHETSYYLWVRFKDATEWSEPETRAFETGAPHPPGSEAQSWEARDGFVVEKFAEDLQLPVSIAMVPDPGSDPSDPLMYVAELYGNIKVILRDRTVRDYATGLLNFNPTGNFPGSGEIGLAGILVEPESGDLFASLLYRGGDGNFHPKVIRLHSDEHGFEATNAGEPETVLDMDETKQGASHQISNLTLSPAGNLLVHNADGGSVEGANQAPDADSFLGKVLRMTLDGKPLPDNPFFTDDGEPFTARDYVYAKGFRNAFGGAWRLSDETHWAVENGPAIDRLAKIERGLDYGWPGDQSMHTRATYNWNPAHAPVSIDFIEAGKHAGSGFPGEAFGHAFVTESGPTYAEGPQDNGKAVVEFGLGEGGELLSGPEMLARYVGTGRATAVGLAAGPGGLYFTDLYKDTGAASPIERGANVLQIRYCGASCPGDPPPPPPALLVDPPPVITGFHSRRKVFAVGRNRRRSARSSRRVRRGTVFAYRLSERARVRIRLRRVGRGRKGPRGALKASGREGRNRRPYAGRLRGRWLPPGRYRATIVARDPAGNVSKARTRFRVVPRRVSHKRHRRPIGG